MSPLEALGWLAVILLGVIVVAGAAVVVLVLVGAFREVWKADRR